jgi:hypothetical protein
MAATSARLAAADERAATQPPCSALVGDPLRTIARLLPDADRFRMRLACRLMRDHAEPMTAPISRVTFLCARSLAVYACDALPGFMLPDTLEMLALAAHVGCVAVLAELMDARGCTGRDLDGRVCCAAAACAQLEALVWLRGRGLSWNTRVCASAAAGGYLKVLRYAHEHGCPWDAYTCTGAADGGHLEVLRYLHEHGCPWDTYTCCAAARGGHLEVLRYLHEHGCPWDMCTCSGAAGGGHLEVLR